MHDITTVLRTRQLKTYIGKLVELHTLTSNTIVSGTLESVKSSRGYVTIVINSRGTLYNRKLAKRMILSVFMNQTPPDLRTYSTYKEEWKQVYP